MVQYGHKMLSDTIGAFCITPKGERVLRNINGNSKHSKIKKIGNYSPQKTYKKSTLPTV